MNKKDFIRAFITIAIIVILVLFVLPLNASIGGSSTVLRPIISDWYVVWKYNGISVKEPLMAHDDPNYKPAKFNRIKGTTIIVFGKVIYDNKYEVPY